MDEVAEVKSRLEITEVVGAYVPLKQAGRNLKAPCPFHQEKSASFMVSPEKGIYHCFGCGEGGDIFSFVMKMEGMDFRQALEMLARKAGVELTARKGESQEANRLRARLLDAHELAVKYFQASLVQNKKALEYVSQKRGLARETVRDFAIGYAPDSWNALTDFLVKKGFNHRELLQGGLAGQKEGRSTIYDLFRGRVVFTISDREGRPIGFTGRVLDDSLPKYLNTPQTPLYDKSQAIFGLHLAKEAIRSHDEAVLVEGNMDVVASHQAGVKQVVAASGTALTLDQLRTLSKLTKNIKLAFDADRAGLAATERAIELGQKLGLTLRMVEMPPGVKDADELIAQDLKAWQGAIADAKYIVDYLFDRFETDFDLSSAVGKRGYTDRLAVNLRRLGDPVEQDHYVKQLAEKTGTSEEAIRAKLAKADDDATRILSAADNSASRRRARPLSSTGGASEQAMVSAGEPSIDATRSDSFGQPVRRAVVQAEGRPTARRLLEESLLAIALVDPATRLALEDLDEADFSSPDRQAIYRALNGSRDDLGAPIAESLTEISDYGKILMLRGEQEFADLAPADRSFEAFGLARRLQMASNKDVKQILSGKLREAEQDGDVQLVGKLLLEYQKLLDEEV
jgi:DNA primase